MNPLAALLAALVPTIAASGQPSIRFSDVTREWRLETVQVSGRSPSTTILEVNGSGLALLDFDADGDLDLFIANGATLEAVEHGPGCRLFENTLPREPGFRDVTSRAGIGITRWAMGVAAADYNGDGFEDLYITCFGPNILLRNNGDGTFADVTATAGVADAGWGTGCAFGDLDGDDDLDLYVANYVEFDPKQPPRTSTYKGNEVLAGPHGMTAQHDVLYENLGDGTFRDISGAAPGAGGEAGSGIRRVTPSYGLGVVILDFTGDGRPDIFVGNDSMPNFLFVNMGGLTFAERGLPLGLSANMDGANQATMGIAIADLDQNGTPDVFTTNFSSDTNTLHLNFGSYFDDRTNLFGLGMISRPYLGWACGFFDFDHDADEDLLIFNGHVYPNATRESMDSPYEQVPLLFGRAGGRFQRLADAACGSLVTEPHRHRGAVWGDLDLDGDIDVIAGELNGPVRIYRNDAGHAPWLTIELRDDREASRNRRGLGSMIELSESDRTQRRWLHSGGSFQSSNPALAHFGLGASVEAVMRRAVIRVTWPDGFVQTVEGIEPDRRVVIRRAD